MNFENCNYDVDEKTFIAEINWQEGVLQELRHYLHHISFEKATKWIFELTFSEDFSFITGSIKTFSSGLSPRNTVSIGRGQSDLTYKLCQADLVKNL